MYWIKKPVWYNVYWFTTWFSTRWTPLKKYVSGLDRYGTTDVSIRAVVVGNKYGLAMLRNNKGR